MPRSRNIKPAFFKNEFLAEAEPFARLLFIGLWTLADKNGILEYRPKRIKAELFPYDDDFDVNRCLTVIERLGFIHVLEGESKEWIHIKNFTKHQRPHHTENTSNPDPKSMIIKCSNDLTVTQPLSNGVTCPDSLNLIPDSLNTDSLHKENPSRKQKKEKRERFEDWYQHYPLKKSKAAALKSWERQNLDERADELIPILAKQKSLDRQYQPGGFIKHPSTYLNQQCWNDEIEEVKNETNLRINQDTRSRAKRVFDNLNEIARADIEANGVTEFLD